MANYTFLVSLVSLIVCAVFDVSLGACNVDEINVQPHFNGSRYQGEWQEIAWIPPTSFPESEYLDAYNHEYVLQDDGSLAYQAWGRYRKTGECVYNDRMLIPTELGQAKFTLAPRQSQVWMVETDYTSYSVQYGCFRTNPDDGTCLMTTSKIWSRRGSLTVEEREKIDLVLNRVCLTWDMFVETKRENPCPYPDDLYGAAPSLNTGISLALLVSLMRIVYEMF